MMSIYYSDARVHQNSRRSRPGGGRSWLPHNPPPLGPFAGLPTKVGGALSPPHIERPRASGQSQGKVNPPCLHVQNATEVIDAISLDRTVRTKGIWSRSLKPYVVMNPNTDHG